MCETGRRRVPFRALLGWSVAGYILGGVGLSSDASEAGHFPRTPPARPTLEVQFQDLNRARQGARQRLGEPQCQAVLTDFRNVTGQRLDDVLRASGRAAQEQFDLLVLLSGIGRPLCERSVALAFTQVSSRTVSICLRPFSLLRPSEQEAVLIHEMLHSLGLGETPPESGAITAQVLKRCGH